MVRSTRRHPRDMAISPRSEDQRSVNASHIRNNTFRQFSRLLTLVRHWRRDEVAHKCLLVVQPHICRSAIGVVYGIDNGFCSLAPESLVHHINDMVITFGNSMAWRWAPRSAGEIFSQLRSPPLVGDGLELVRVGAVALPFHPSNNTVAYEPRIPSQAPVMPYRGGPEGYR